MRLLVAVAVLAAAAVVAANARHTTHHPHLRVRVHHAASLSARDEGGDVDFALDAGLDAKSLQEDLGGDNNEANEANEADDDQADGAGEDVVESDPLASDSSECVGGDCDKAVGSSECVGGDCAAESKLEEALAPTSSLLRESKILQDAHVLSESIHKEHISSHLKRQALDDLAHIQEDAHEFSRTHNPNTRKALALRMEALRGILGYPRAHNSNDDDDENGGVVAAEGDDDNEDDNGQVAKDEGEGEGEGQDEGELAKDHEEDVAQSVAVHHKERANRFASAPVIADLKRVAKAAKHLALSAADRKELKANIKAIAEDATERETAAPERAAVLDEALRDRVAALHMQVHGA